LDAIQNFGHKNVKAISAYVGTRSATQVRTHAQKYFLKAARENKAREKATMIQVDSASVNESSETEQRSRCESNHRGGSGNSGDQASVLASSASGSGGSPAGDDLYSDSGKQACDGAARRWQVGRNGPDGSSAGKLASAQGGREGPSSCRGARDDEQGGDGGGDSQSGGSEGEFEDEDDKADSILAGEEPRRSAAGRRDAIQRGHMLA